MFEPPQLRVSTECSKGRIRATHSKQTRKITQLLSFCLVSAIFFSPFRCWQNSLWLSVCDNKSHFLFILMFCHVTHVHSACMHAYVNRFNKYSSWSRGIITCVRTMIGELLIELIMRLKIVLSRRVAVELTSCVCDVTAKMEKKMHKQNALCLTHVDSGSTRDSLLSPFFYFIYDSKTTFNPFFDFDKHLSCVCRLYLWWKEEINV